MKTAERTEPPPHRQEALPRGELSALECWSRSPAAPLAGHDHDPVEPHILLGVD